ncbi:MAG: SDR family oxidoreductase, partial [Gammaproteobacteria bacterium]|nr:SDR family oxidoreductase [Gammaproteobacteria bacterium]
GRLLNVAAVGTIDDFVKDLVDQKGAPAILVNNAGITRDNLLMRMSDEEWDLVISTNLTGLFHLTKACIRPMMKARFGRVVNVGSVVGYTGNPGQSNYCASKAGVLGFSKALALEIASRGITVNVVAPGFIETDMTGKLTEEQKSAILAQVPMARMGKPDDIAAAVRFLVSDAAGYITGVTLHVNGGMYLA